MNAQGFIWQTKIVSWLWVAISTKQKYCLIRNQSVPSKLLLKTFLSTTCGNFVFIQTSHFQNIVLADFRNMGEQLMTFLSLWSTRAKLFPTTISFPPSFAWLPKRTLYFETSDASKWRVKLEVQKKESGFNNFNVHQVFVTVEWLNLCNGNGLQQV